VRALIQRSARAMSRCGYLSDRPWRVLLKMQQRAVQLIREENHDGDSSDADGCLEG
jgi:hypothetical protein